MPCYLIPLWLIVLTACTTVDSNNGAETLIETTINGKPLSDAHCIINTNNENWTVTTPSNVKLGPINGDLRIVCNKQGYRTAEIIFKSLSTFSGSNVRFVAGGGSGHVEGGVVVPIRLNRENYPSRITVDLTLQQ